MPVIVVSAFSPSQGARAVDALAEGAFDLVAKPAVGEGLEGFAAGPRDQGQGRHQRGARRPVTGDASQMRQPRRPVRSSVARAVLIATSTGGPKALAALMPKLPAPLGVGTLIVQHMPPGFTKSLAARLDQASALEHPRGRRRRVARSRASRCSRPGGKHMRVATGGRINLTDEPEIGALRPRADLMISDAAKVFGERTLLVVMTGHGQ